MKTNRELVVRKIDKFVFDKKIINIITAVMAFLFAVMFSAICVEETKKEAYYQSIYNKMQQDMISNNMAIINSSTIDCSNSNAVNQEPMFTSAKQAVAYAFDLFYNYSAYEMHSSGVTLSQAVGQNVEIKLQGESYKFTDGNQLSKSYRFETKTNFGQSGATEVFYQNGKRYERCASVQNNNGSLGANFTGEYKSNNNLTSTKQPFYVVNNDTIIMNNYFSFKRDKNGNIAEYQASVELSPTKAVEGYDEEIKEQGGTSLPTFSYVSMDCVIDGSGHLVAFAVKEKMTLVKKIVFNITATTTNEFNYVIASYNIAPSVEEPNI